MSSSGNGDASILPTAMVSKTCLRSLGGFAFFKQDSDGAVHSHVFSSLGYINFTKDAFVNRFKFHCGFVGFKRDHAGLSFNGVPRFY